MQERKIHGIPFIFQIEVLNKHLFITLAEADGCEQEDMWNYFRIMGEGWQVPTPWD